MNFYPVIMLSSLQFTYDAKTKCLVSEASDLENRHLQRLYSNSCDVGFIVSFGEFGGSTDIVFVLSETKLFPDDDGIVSWEYVPAAESLKKYPVCAGMTATVFND